MKVELIHCTPNPVETIAKIASICYDSQPTKPLETVKSLYKSGHHSVFEHVFLTFKIEEISRACSHQLVRHRMCSFTQRSQRYCSESDCNFVTPQSFVGEASEYKNMLSWLKTAHLELCQEQDSTDEDSRYILPNAIHTKMYLSCNLRQLMHIANERLCSRAQWEIRQLVAQMVKLVDQDLSFMLTPKCEKFAPSYFCTETSSCGKHRSIHQIEPLPC